MTTTYSLYRMIYGLGIVFFTILYQGLIDRGVMFALPCICISLFLVMLIARNVERDSK